jgi:Flp pilus assembly protein TadD
LHKLRREEEALKELLRATELSPEDPDPYYILGQAYRKQGKIEEADKAYEKFRALKKKRRGE